MNGPAVPFVRSNVWELAPGDPTLAAYAQAVAVMQRRSHRDPTSWFRQAAIHGTLMRPRPPLADECKHGTWFFLAWHRMFVHRFEQIVREAVREVGGPADWALPYWNYGLGGEQATIPLAFRSRTLASGEPNPLFVAQRAPGVNAGAGIPPTMASPRIALARPSFTGATELGGGVTPPIEQFYRRTGRLEQTPHNDVHNALGGADGWMADPDQAAQDPIFWLHHTNIDRVWDEWDTSGTRAPADSAWLDQEFELYDASGARASLACAAVRDVRDLGYIYDTSPAPARRPGLGILPPTPSEEPMPPEREPEIVGASDAPVVLAGAAIGVTVAVDRRARQGLVGAAEARPEHAYLTIDDIEAERNPGTVYGVYVNLPDDPSERQLEEHHAGNVSFFGIERARDPRGDEPSHGLRIAFEITGLIDALAARGAWSGDELAVTFRPIDLIPPLPDRSGSVGLTAAETVRPAGPDDPPVTIGRVGLFYA